MPVLLPKTGKHREARQFRDSSRQGRFMHLTLHSTSSEGLQSDTARLAYAREIVRAEGDALHLVAERLDDSFLKAVNLIYSCSGRIGITGTGKSADVGQKIAGTLNSTGTRAYVLDA